MSSTTIYLKLPQVKEVYEPEVYLGMIADVHSSDRAAEAKAKAVKITSFSGKGKEAVFVGNVMELVEKIEKTGQNIQVDNVGESDFVVTYRAGKKKSLVWEWMKTAMVSAVAFFGAAFAIMTFNNDANVTDVFAKLYEMIIGTRAGQPRRILEAQKYTLLLSLAYTTALCLAGLLLAAPFTHIFTPDPRVSALAVTAIHIFSIGVVPLAVQYVIVDGLNGMGMMQFSLPLSFFRKAVYFAALFALPAAFGAVSTFCAETISDLIPPLVTVLFYRRKLGWIREQALSHRGPQGA